MVLSYWARAKAGFCATIVTGLLGVGVSNAASAGTAYSTQAFLNNLGINAHVSLAQGPYNDVVAVTGRLAYLGIHNVRDDVRNTTSSINRYATLGSAGNLLMLMMSPKILSNPATALTAFHPIAKYVNYIEGTNEINVTPVAYGGYTGAAGAQAWQRALYAAAKEDGYFANTAKVLQFTYGPAVYNPAATGVADYSNVHIYPLWKQPPYSIFVSSAATMGVPDRQVFVTETNYPTSVDPAKGVPEDIQAKYLLDAIFDSFKLGFVATYIYEVSDEGTDITNQEDNFGLFRFDGSAKPSATAIHNLTAILSSTTTTSFTPSGLSYSISQSLTSAAMDANVFHFLLEKPDGTFLLVLWAEPPLYNVPAPSPHPVTILLSSKHSQIQVLDPLVGTTAVNSFSNVSQVTVSTLDHPIILSISKN